MATGIFDQEILLCIEEAEILRRGKWHQINICPWCSCQAPLDSLSSFAASFIIRQPRESGKPWASVFMSLLNHTVDEVIRQQGQETEPNIRQQRYDCLKTMYKEHLDSTIERSKDIMWAFGRDHDLNHELLPGIHRSDPFETYLDMGPSVNIMVCQILLNQLEPIRRYIRSEYSLHFRFSNGQDMTLGTLLIAAAKTGQQDLAREILNHGVFDDMKHDALEVAFEREDLPMIKLLLLPQYKHTSEGSRRRFIEGLLIRSTRLGLRDMTNTLLGRAEYMSLDFLHELLANACYNGDDDLVQRLFVLHRYLDVNKRSAYLKWTTDLNYVTYISPLEITTSKGHQSTLRLLLEKGADPSAVFAMRGAARGGHVGIARILHELGVHPPAGFWLTVIHGYTLGRQHGAQNGEFISFILDGNMLDIDMQLKQYRRELYWMVYDLCLAEDIRAIRLFAAHGMPLFGDFYSMNPGLAPMDVAELNGSSDELKEALQELGVPPVPRTYHSAQHDRQPGFQQYPFSPQEVSLRCSQRNCKFHAPERWRRYKLLVRL